ncbi:flagellar biosynthesis protein FliR [Pragia fontium]|uniref:Flagellar biosynthetic protein FliR n=1 Tax=Pragia fontium TaxID=82985 RepID=A0ABQ5LIY3_9GAMM|nr:flagellar biosynthetic protein FliR [Pragia fontium]AKJ41366.1 flagellar biosynthesis protein FliR [Pragia fontium]GKX62922.1 flagellar biosynthesis protein FliR [Pragia fontium]SUB81613.1 flagellar biosynthesis protein FliR [Pragia fontium]
MGIDINTLITPMLAIWLPFVRILAFFHFCPIFDQRSFPLKAKVALSLLLAIVMTPMIASNVVLNDLLTVRSLVLIGEQILWGFIFGTLLQFVFVALQTAGHILSFNMGLGMAIMNDPNSGASTTVISQIIFIFSALLFLSMDGHLLFITILFKGFTYWPIGQAINDLSLRTLVLGLSWVISSAVLLSLPTTLIMLVVQGVFGLLNRVSPTLNLFSLGFPISMLFGLFCLMLLAGNIPDHYLNLTNMVLDQLDKLRINHG